MVFAKEWKVPPTTSSAPPPTSVPARRSISWAALRVNVSSTIERAGMPVSTMRATR